MQPADREKLIKLIDEAKVVSFDVFDTLLYRRVNTPETIFELIGKHFHINSFKRIRIDAQNEASVRLAPMGYPHPDMDEIYEVLSENTEYDVNWDEVKTYEYAIEKDALVGNPETKEIFDYAKKADKRIIATTDMYLRADFISEVLKSNGFDGFDEIYCSADERKAKFNKELFKEVISRETVNPEEILHIGDSQTADVEYPESLGMKAFLYKCDADMEKLKPAGGSDIDKALYKILCDSKKSFWYNLGVEVGGPLYFGLFRWMEDVVKSTDKTVYFISRDGYNLYELFREKGYENIRYFYASRRSLVLAGITELDEESLALLPPYTTNQKIEDILDYLGIDRKDFIHLEDEGFSSYSDILDCDEKREAFKRLYVLNKDTFLKLCETEREYANAYFKGIGLLDNESIVFDCGWNGSSQYLLHRVKKALGYDHKDKFYYFGIISKDRARKQLHGLRYETYLFDHCTNFPLQQHVYESVALYELFFSAPHQSVYKYGPDGVIFEDGSDDEIKNDILSGIRDFINEGYEFTSKYDVDIIPYMAVGHFKRLMEIPTPKEAATIGDVENVDGFARRKGEVLKIAYVTKEQLEADHNHEIYWLNGLLSREDIPLETRKYAAFLHARKFPVEMSGELHFENPKIIRDYERWIRKNEREEFRQEELGYNPLFSVVVPVYNVTTEQLTALIDSVLGQTYQNYELILVDDHSTWSNVREILQKYEDNPKIKILYREKNGHISVATNDGINAASGDFIVFSDCDDMLVDRALYCFAKKLNDNPELDFIYTDEDKITEDGTIRHMPFFKPEWSPDLYMCMNYTNHLSAYRASLVKQTGGLRSEYNGGQDYDFTLRFMELSDNKRVGHIPQILYRWRERRESVAYSLGSKNYAAEAARFAKEDALKRRGIKGYMELIPESFQYRPVYETVGNPLVSIIIPSKDHPDILKQCVDSVYEFTDYKNIEIIVVDNGSSDENRKKISEYLNSVNAAYIYEESIFNFSYMCNAGVKASKGEYVLFLNDDIEAFRPGWLSRMLGQAMQPHSGAVGARLYYPYTDVIQHGGVINTEEFGPRHMSAGEEDDNSYYFGFNRIDYDCIAVTAACLLVSRKKFDQIGGFDENFPVAYNDVDLCFKLHEAGFYNVLRNDAILYHHESLSRGTDQLEEKKYLRLGRELEDLYIKHPALRGYDPYLNSAINTYGEWLDLKDKYDFLEDADLEGAEPGGMAYIDSIDMGREIMIRGWCYLEGEKDYRSLKRYILLENPYGEIKTSRVSTVERGDIEETHPEWEDGFHTGFEFLIEKKSTRADIMPYHLGVMTIDSNGIKKVCWCGESIPAERDPEGMLGYSKASLMREKFVKSDNATEVKWYVDEFTERDEGFYLKGFAFADTEDHYKYDTEIILADEAGNACMYSKQSLERADVASFYPAKSFLYNTGFSCLISEKSLDKAKTYQLFLRLENREDPSCKIDIETGHRIEHGKIF